VFAVAGQYVPPIIAMSFGTLLLVGLLLVELVLKQKSMQLAFGRKVFRNVFRAGHQAARTRYGTPLFSGRRVADRKHARRRRRAEPIRHGGLPFDYLFNAENGRQTSGGRFGLFPSDFVLNHIPMLREKSVLDPNNVRGDPVDAFGETGESAVYDDEISISHNYAGSYLSVGGRLRMRLKSPSRPGVMWALCWI